ncbi:hypothetical protein [Streptomyces sp. BE303]|uniref:hypothetical protein n=1 Tax=Streptomyces sp. BE303 TaxID=3002528 RepID=UPI002E77021A|nr:hypothetical protein [Streptomyces sp. BE303]MED7948794.1 hypothetical protein [Streptomyces sp. BE303]
MAPAHLPEERSAAVIALISVVSTIGAGVGYPLARTPSSAGYGPPTASAWSSPPPPS